MLRVVSCVALALSLLGCYAGGAGASPGESLGGLAAPSAPSSEPVPLLTVETQTSFGSCVLDLSYVADVIADPTSGAPTYAATGEALAWPRGFTARRAGSEVEVLDPSGNVGLTTGRRYRLCPAPDDRNVGSGLAARSPRGGWVIGMVDECMDCELGGYGDPRNLPDCTANPTDARCQPDPNTTQTPPQPSL
jgi:hypothetical protein